MTWAQPSAIYEPYNHQRRIIGFDTFSGFPSIDDKDARGTSEFMKEGGLAVASEEDLKQCISLYDMNRFINHVPKVKLVKGDIKETVPEYIKANPHTVVSLLHLDVDIFEPTAVALRHFVPRMSKGSIIVFDECNSQYFPGETLAVMEELGLGKIRIERLPFDASPSYVVIE